MCGVSGAQASTLGTARLIFRPAAHPYGVTEFLFASTLSLPQNDRIVSRPIASFP